MEKLELYFNTILSVAVPGIPLKIEDGDTAICYQTLFYGLHKLEQENGSIIKRVQGICLVGI